MEFNNVMSKKDAIMSYDYEDLHRSTKSKKCKETEKESYYPRNQTTNEEK
jgi:hypothetical protein